MGMVRGVTRSTLYSTKDDEGGGEGGREVYRAEEFPKVTHSRLRWSGWLDAWAFGKGLMTPVKGSLRGLSHALCRGGSGCGLEHLSRLEGTHRWEELGEERRDGEL